MQSRAEMRRGEPNQPSWSLLESGRSMPKCTFALFGSHKCTRAGRVFFTPPSCCRFPSLLKQTHFPSVSYFRRDAAYNVSDNYIPYI